MMVDRFPYKLLYRLKDGVVIILVVAHGHRRPRYWEDRLSG
jgi:mRNA-degrading endonuclease RelE of RelBE toxin-antitoxin system